MAKMVPFFLTGANAKVKINNRTAAFCANLSYSIEVTHAAPRLLGMYEAASLEPLAYSVSGSFSVVRYADGIVKALQEQVDTDGKKDPKSVPSGVSDFGNGVGAYSPFDRIAKQFIGQDIWRSSPGNDGRLHESFNPAALENAIRFDIEVYQKTAIVQDGSKQLAAIARIRDCRITKSDLSLSKKDPAIQTFQFTALYVDEDSFLADMSGQGQHLT